MKKLLSTLLLALPLILFGQESEFKNEYSLGIHYSYLTSGDQSGFHISNKYERYVFPRIGLGLAIGYIISANESGILLQEVPSNYENNIATGDWGSVEDGIKILDLKTDHQSYIHSDLTINFRVIDLNSFSLKVNLGGSLAYISNTYITRWELGSFTGEASGEKDLQLVYPYYSRLLDIGFTIGIDILYKINNRFMIGLFAGGNNYFKSGYRFYDIGLKSGFRF
jgi:hypothetical protein